MEAARFNLDELEPTSARRIGTLIRALSADPERARGVFVAYNTVSKVVHAAASDDPLQERIINAAVDVLDHHDDWLFHSYGDTPDAMDQAEEVAIQTQRDWRIARLAALTRMLEPPAQA